MAGPADFSLKRPFDSLNSDNPSPSLEFPPEKKLRPSEEIYSHLSTKNPSLTRGNLERTYFYIQANEQLFAQARILQESVYVRREETGLERTLQFSPEGNVYMHLNRISEGDISLGAGVEKIVCLALELFSGEYFASASFPGIPMSEEEREALAFFKGVPGFVQMVDEAKYDYSKKQQERFASPATEKKQRVVFSLCNGGDLDKWMTDILPYLSPETALAYKKCIVEELVKHISVMHANGWIHRDLKQKNIFLHFNPQGFFEVVIGDLGSSCRTDQAAKKRQFTTTPSVAAPEIVTLSRELDGVLAQIEDNGEVSSEEESAFPVAAASEKSPETHPDQIEEGIASSGPAEEMSPQDTEQLQQKIEIAEAEQQIRDDIEEATTQALDMWSLGCVLYPLLTGLPLPWEHKEELDEMSIEIQTFAKAEKMKEWFPEPENKNSPLHLVWEMLQLEPAERISADRAQAKVATLLWE